MIIYFIQENRTGIHNRNCIHSVHLTSEEAYQELDELYHNALDDNEFQVQNKNLDTLMLHSPTNQTITYKIISKEVTFKYVKMDNEYLNSTFNNQSSNT